MAAFQNSSTNALSNSTGLIRDLGTARPAADGGFFLPRSSAKTIALEQYFARVARLARVDRRLIAKRTQKFLRNPESRSNEVRKRLHDLSTSVLESTNERLCSAIQLALLNTRSLVSCYLQRQPDFPFRRGERGLVDEHDVLYQFAQLIVGAQIDGYGEYVEDLKSLYFNTVPQAADDELFRIYLALVAIETGYENYMNGFAQFPHLASMKVAGRAFALGSRYALGLTHPFFLVLSGGLETARIPLAIDIAQLSFARFVNEELDLSQLADHSGRSVFRYLEKLLHSGESAIVDINLHHARERFAVSDIAAKFAISSLLVMVEGEGGTERWRADAPRFHAFPNCLTIQPSLATHELALFVLRQIPPGISRTDRFSNESISY